MTRPQARRPTRVQTAGEADPPWVLRLYVAGATPRSAAAFRNLTQVCEEYLKGQYRIDVIDLLAHPQLAQGDQILAVPTLVRKLPAPIRRIIGDLSNTERVLVGLDLRPGASPPARTARRPADV
ncbi:hypothetical protein TBR22_A40630 [Luteitalea sp. TBR-22]|uniref:circadian clock KaiB family protein n=1 Tax=Luteitalea sp. TBR-22 TaxID=2802971 RepID=UPI001AFB1920|nr:circadian clock KaiB family protein [Luteitalea sp. TBR-22]BCS34837.1 hypothetical protein TBR22_A40630 [Luteitalea sp. TBR-22]